MRITKPGHRFVFLSAFIFTVFIGIAVALGDPYAARSAVSAGQKAPSFRTITLDRKTINFPADYKGKVVLLDFWATYCKPCRAELPKTVAAYAQYHDKGFEVLSVSFDLAKAAPALYQFIKDNNMTWPQVYDGQAIKTPVGVKYGVNAIPCAVLVDGDTGLILATDLGAMGHKLTKAVESALAAKAKK